MWWTKNKTPRKGSALAAQNNLLKERFNQTARNFYCKSKNAGSKVPSNNGYYAKTRVDADKIAAANAKANEGAYADAQFAKQKAMVAFYKEQEEAEDKAGERAEYLKQVFHMLAGETSSISVGMKELPPILDKAAIAAYKLAAAMGDTRTAASAVLSSMVQMDAARLRKQGQVQAVAAGFVSRPEVDNVASRAAVNAARTAILEKNNAPETGSKGPLLILLRINFKNSISILMLRSRLKPI
jgi:hypothetical protein